ncbi:MAG TPA: hypothetical protein VNW95_17510 [Mucilaginibacter sp.]|jgi:hypothetical protein|nr:hypothetical protein [Mucilaginibacter sp.]
MNRMITIALLAAMSSFKASAQATVAAKDAGKHIGQTVKICEKVYNGKFISVSNTTLLYLGGDYPNQALTVIISGAGRGKFKGRPEVDDKGKDFIVTGKLINYQGKPGIVISRPAQLKAVLIDNSKQPALKLH